MASGISEIYKTYKRSQALIDIQRYEQALDTLYEIVVASGILKKDVQFSIAYCYYKTNKAGKARRVLHESISEFPNFNKAHCLLSILYKPVDIELSLIHCNKSLELDPSIDSQIVLKADILVSKDEYIEARNLLDRVKDKNSRYFIFVFCLLSAAVGNEKDLKYNLAKGLELYPNDIAFIALKADLNYRKNNFDEAYELSKRALEINPNHVISQRIYKSVKYKIPETMPGGIIVGIIILLLHILLLLIS